MKSSLSSLLVENWIKYTQPYLSVAAILKNEAPYIKEWIEFHRMVGVERFYLYDNGSTDDVYEILKPYIKSKIVVYKELLGEAQQLKAYKKAVKHYKYKTKWLAFIDLDEFIVPTSEKKITSILKIFEKYPALGINWLMFDYNGHETKPQGLVIENYTRVNYSLFDNLHIKSITNPREVNGFPNPHGFIYKDDKKAVTENYETIEGHATTKHSINKVRINHYHCKSREEYMEKLAKGLADQAGFRPFDERLFDFGGDERDTFIIDNYLEELKARLK